MEYVDPPNRPMNTAFSPSCTPIMYKDTIFIDFSNSGNLLVGSADVRASFWQGSLLSFPSYDAHIAGKHSFYYNSQIIFHGKYLSNNKLVVAESEAKLKVLSQSVEDSVGGSNDKLFIEDCQEHYEEIHSIALWNSTNKVLTASVNHITQWDIGSGLKEDWNYANYHADDITGVETNKNNTNIFVSIGCDRLACIWDLRTSSVVMELFRNDFCAFTAVAWSPVDEDIIIVGTQAGSLYMLDLKAPNEFLNVQHCHKKNIHRLEFDKVTAKLAVAGNTNEIQVYNCKGNEFNGCYSNFDKHKDYIRDSKWFNGQLYTCGLQSGVIKHSI